MDQLYLVIPEVEFTTNILKQTHSGMRVKGLGFSYHMKLLFSLASHVLSSNNYSFNLDQNYYKIIKR